MMAVQTNDNGNNFLNMKVLPGRWDNIIRTYTEEDVYKLRGSVTTASTFSQIGAEKIWKTFMTEDYVNALGALTGNQAVQMARAGLKAIYLSGWQTAADANLACHTYPDRSLYPSNSVPEIVKKLNYALQRADQMELSEKGRVSRDWFLPIIADAEAGFGGPLNCFEITKSMIEAGAAGVHFEDQLTSEKKCGHLGGKVLVPVNEFIKKLIAARLGADVMGVPITIIGRTDANSAKLISSNIDPVDEEFLLNSRTEEGYYRYKGGIDAAIKRSLAFAPYCDLIWWETSSPDLKEAKLLSESIRKYYPNKMFAYNCSPSFNWRNYLTSCEIAKFQREMGAMGFKFQFITSAGFHALNYSMFKLATGYKTNGMTTFVDLQAKEFEATKEGYTAVYQQKEVANGYFDEVLEVIYGKKVETMGMPESTEQEQFLSLSA
ncbi:MAG: isocitrate lyase [Gammaproteobacteria bacterium]|nr:MAG: isocitrate lyase [Gammaproteobacteria bacterium]